MSEEKPFKLNKKEICITSTQIKQAIDLLVNENEILRDRIYELEEVLDKIKEYVENLLKEEFEITDPDNINYGEKCQRAYFSDSELEKILELLEEIE